MIQKCTCWNFLSLVFFFHLFICFPSFAQHFNNCFSSPWSFSLILGNPSPPLFACLQSSFIPLPHLGWSSLPFVRSLSSSPAYGSCPPSPERFKERRMKRRDYFTLQFIRSSSPEFLFMHLHTLKSSPSFLLWSQPFPSCLLWWILWQWSMWAYKASHSAFCMCR